MEETDQSQYVRRYRPLLAEGDKPVTPKIEVRANEITRLHYRVAVKDGVSKAFWDRQIFAALNEVIGKSGLIPTYEYDAENQQEVDKAVHLESVHLLQVASILLAEQEIETGKKTPKRLLAGKLVGIIECTYHEMKCAHEHDKRGYGSGFTR